jgi:hypothetical protein
MGLEKTQTIGRIVVPPHQSQHRLRRGAGRGLEHQSGAWAVQDHRRRTDLDPDQVPERQGRRGGRRDGSEQPRGALRGELGADPRSLLPAERRPRQCAMEEHRRRRHLERDQGRRLPGVGERPHRPGDRGQQSPGRLRHGRGRHQPQRQAREGRQGTDLAERTVSQRRCGKVLDQDGAAERAALLLLSGAGRSQGSGPGVLLLDATGLVRRRRQDRALGQPGHPRGLARPLDRSRGPQSPGRGQRRRRVADLGQGRQLDCPQPDPDRPVL